MFQKVDNLKLQLRLLKWSAPSGRWPATGWDASRPARHTPRSPSASRPGMPMLPLLLLLLLGLRRAAGGPAPTGAAESEDEASGTASDAAFSSIPRLFQRRETARSTFSIALFVALSSSIS